MNAAPRPTDEAERLKALRAYDLLDTPAEEAFDDLTRLAAQVCDAPIALVCLVDEERQWFKSKFGLEVSETPRDLSFCAHAVCQRDLFVVEDAARDERFAHNPFVVGNPHIRFYAGMPLSAPEGGHAIGTLCVLDRQPRRLTPPQIEALRILSHQVMMQLELRRNLMELERSVANHLRAEEALRRAEEKYRRIFDDPRALPEVHLRFLARLDFYAAEGQGRRLSQPQHKAPHRMITAGKALLAHQVLINALDGQTGLQSSFDAFLPRFAQTLRTETAQVPRAGLRVGG